MSSLVGGALVVAVLLPTIAGGIGGYYLSGKRWWGAVVGVGGVMILQQGISAAARK